MKEKCDHAVGTFNFRLAESHALIYQFDFCPLCGSPLRETALDRVLWRAVNKPNPGGLFPSQSLEHAVAFLKQNWDGESYLMLFQFEDGTWEVHVRATDFHSKDLSKALTKALLWATTELDKETVESLIKEEES